MTQMTTIQTNWRALHGDHFKDRRALVTGGAGFIGSHIAEALTYLGASVVVLDDLSGGCRQNLAGFGPVEFVAGSVADRDVVAGCMEGCQYVFHQAALGSVPGSIEEPAKYYQANSTGTFNVLEAARAAGVKRVMFAASASAYGENRVPWVESQPVSVKSPYAATKAAGEAMLASWAACYGLDTCSLRYFNIFGPRQNANSAYAAVIAAFAKAVLTGNTILINGDGEQTRDFTYVDNVVHANLLAARQPEPIGGEVINVGCGRQISVNQLAKLVVDALDRPSIGVEHRPERAGDLKHSYASLDKARSLLQYQPVVDFEPGLRVTLDWYRSGGMA